MQWLKVAVQDAGTSGFIPSGYYWRLLEHLSDRTLRIVDRNSPDVDILVCLDRPRHPAISTLSSAASRAIERRLGRPVDLSWPSKARQLQDHAPLRLWFTEENHRPPTQDWDLSFSFDLDPLSGSNVYLPVWWKDALIINHGDPASFERLGHRMSMAALLEHRETNTADRPGFACAFVNNPEPMRIAAIRQLGEVGPVDVFGRLAGRSIKHKGDVALNYRYMVCFENDVYPGYVTEKPFEAWSLGCIPLWRGSDPAGYLNHGALLLSDGETSIDRLCEQVATLDADRAAVDSRSSAPILARMPTLNSARDAFARVWTERVGR